LATNILNLFITVILVLVAAKLFRIQKKLTGVLLIGNVYGVDIISIANRNYL